MRRQVDDIDVWEAVGIIGDQLEITGEGYPRSIRRDREWKAFVQGLGGPKSQGAHVFQGAGDLIEHLHRCDVAGEQVRHINLSPVPALRLVQERELSAIREKSGISVSLIGANPDDRRAEDRIADQEVVTRSTI